MKAALLKTVDFYQKKISPRKKGPCCRFVPTCSEYAKEAIERYGALKGGALAAKRLLKCQPLCRGGLDPVPERTGMVIRRDENQ